MTAQETIRKYGTVSKLGYVHLNSLDCCNFVRPIHPSAAPPQLTLTIYNHGSMCDLRCEIIEPSKVEAAKVV